MLKGIIKVIDNNFKNIIKIRKYKRKKNDDSFVSKSDIYIEKLVDTYVKSNDQATIYYLRKL